MASIIVPIAAKPAKFGWRTPMLHDPVTVSLRVDPDPRLLGVLGSAVRFQLLQAGLDSRVADEFSNAAEDVCRETLLHTSGPESGLEVRIETFHDRVETSIHCHGQKMPAIGLETFAVAGVLSGGSGGINGLELLSRVDRVLFNTDQDSARTTLVKFLPSKT